MADLTEFYEQRHLWRDDGGFDSHAICVSFSRDIAGHYLLFTPCGIDLGRADSPTTGRIFQAPRGEATCKNCAEFVCAEFVCAEFVEREEL